MHNWSMIPVGTPVANCSARWVSNASSVGVNVLPIARAVASSKAALDDKPAPTGIVVETLPEIPTGDFMSDATAETYRPHDGSIVASNESFTSNETCPGISAESSDTVVSVSSYSIVVYRSIAIGNTSPPV